MVAKIFLQKILMQGYNNRRFNDSILDSEFCVLGETYDKIGTSII